VKRRAVIILPTAERDLEEVYAWLADRDAEAAIRWYNRLIGVILSLAIFPERCPLAPESPKFKNEIRQILHGQKPHKYRILFNVTIDGVRVLHVRHGARLNLGEAQSSGD